MESPLLNNVYNCYFWNLNCDYFFSNTGTTCVKTSIIFLFWVEWALQNVTFELFHVFSTVFTTSHNFPTTPERSISGSSWAGGGSEETCWTPSHWTDTNTKAVIAGQEASLWEFIWLKKKKKKIPLFLFHYKIPTLKGENIHAKQKTNKVNKNKTDFSNMEFKHSAVTKWNVFLTEVSSLSGKFCHVCMYFITFHSVSI